MQQVGDGFLAGKHLFAWGTTLDDVRAKLALTSHAVDDTQLEIACEAAFGLAIVGVELRAPHADRPIIDLCYQLACKPGSANPQPQHFSAALQSLFGKPLKVEADDLPDHGDQSDSVRYYANWERKDHAIGLSVYGSPRETERGNAAGCIWLSWSPIKAAQPYIADWRKRSSDLAAMTATWIAGFGLGAEQQPVFGQAGRLAGKAGAMREADYALREPDILQTPEPISVLAGKSGMVIWLCAESGSRCLSTAWDTVVFRPGVPVNIGWNDSLPAKGGGFSEIAIGSWTVRDKSGSSAIREAVDALKTIPGVRIAHNTGYDV